MAPKLLGVYALAVHRDLTAPVAPAPAD
jgi:hypothetical protein